jgi:hypothetical protein
VSNRLVPLDELVTVDEIAKRLHWSINSCINVVTGRDSRLKHKFPKPLVGSSKHGVWMWSDIKEWKKLVGDDYISGKQKTSKSSTSYKNRKLAS